MDKQAEFAMRSGAAPETAAQPSAGRFLTSDDDRGETIVAIATPSGIGGVGIVRMSGPCSSAIARAIFRRSLDRPVRGLPPGRMLHGYVLADDGAVLDEVLCCSMPAPHSYTAEDVVEIHGHGGPLVLRSIVDRCVSAGARPAHPGEFTLRAFLNGRIDLAQAEAVADIIAARGDAALRIAERQLRGELSRRLATVRAPLIELLAHCEAVVDFAEEGVPDIQAAGARRLLDAAEAELAALLAEAQAGRAVREGVRAAIVGRPNVGKSSLLNALLRADRAIVTPIAGTTRDTVEATVIIGDLPVTFVDTAGLHTAADGIERIGIERAWRALATADLAILVLDGAAPLQPDDDRLLDAVVRARESRVTRGQQPVGDDHRPCFVADPANEGCVLGDRAAADEHSPRAVSQPNDGPPAGRQATDKRHEQPVRWPASSRSPNATGALVSSSRDDGSAQSDEEPSDIIVPAHAIVVVNKADLPAAWALHDLGLADSVPIVATTLVGDVDIAALEHVIRSEVLGSALLGEHEPILSNLRHIHLLRRCRDQLAAARASVEVGLAPDFTATDLREALDSLCGITGEAADEALLNEIFERFCIGK